MSKDDAARKEALGISSWKETYTINLIPCQIAIATEHSDSEAAWLSTLNQYQEVIDALRFASSISITFLWIVERIPTDKLANEVQQKGTMRLKLWGKKSGGWGNENAESQVLDVDIKHPEFLRRYITVKEASPSVGRLLECARERGENKHLVQYNNASRRSGRSFKEEPVVDSPAVSSSPDGSSVKPQAKSGGSGTKRNAAIAAAGKAKKLRITKET